MKTFLYIVSPSKSVNNNPNLWNDIKKSAISMTRFGFFSNYLSYSYQFLSDQLLRTVQIILL